MQQNKNVAQHTKQIGCNSLLKEDVAVVAAI
jgi:hypothetical protein